MIELGASRVDIGQPDDVTWVVMADPKGTSSACSPLRRLGTDNGWVLFRFDDR